MKSLICLMLLFVLNFFIALGWSQAITSSFDVYQYDQPSFAEVVENHGYGSPPNFSNTAESLPSFPQLPTDKFAYVLSDGFVVTKSLAGHAGYKSALGQFKNTSFTNVGRALTKHPEVIGSTKQSLRQGLRTDAQINKAGAEALKNIMRNGVKSTSTHPRYGEIVTHQLKGGHGARFNAKTNEFIGFINP